MKKTYLWEGVTLEGKITEGLSKNKSRKELVQKLRDQNIYQVQSSIISEKLLQQAISLDELLDIIQSLNFMLGSGLSTQKVLQLLISEKRSSISQYIFIKIHHSLIKGNKFHQAIIEIEYFFPKLFVKLIGSTSESGKLAETLQTLEKFYRARVQQIKQIKKALQYPKLIFVFISLVVLGILIFVIPMFSNIYALAKGNLPFLTKALIALSNALREYFVLFIGGGIIFFLFTRLPKIKKFNLSSYFFRWIQKPFQKFDDLLIYSQTFSLLLENGIHTQEAGQVVLEGMSKSNKNYGKDILDSLEAGNSFSGAFDETSWFPKVFTAYLKSPEEAGVPHIGFQQIYQCLWKQQNQSIQKWTKVIEPLSIVILGGIVLAILLSVYLPIFTLGDYVS
ncbi:MAG: type II secretory pathway component PulF [bacterium]|jgi:type II secretory pathway component PulF